MRILSMALALAGCGHFAVVAAPKEPETIRLNGTNCVERRTNAAVFWSCETVFLKLMPDGTVRWIRHDDAGKFASEAR